MSLLRGIGGLLISLMMVLSVGATQAQEMPWDRLTAEARRLRAEGRYAEAQKVYQAALEEAEGPGTKTPLLATSLHNLAAVLLDQGRFVEAEPHLQRALDLWGALRPPDHPAVAATTLSLASAYHGLGRYREGILFARQALEIREKVFWANHAEVALVLNNLA